MEDPRRIGTAWKLFCGTLASLILLQEGHKTGPRGSEVGIRLEEVRHQLAGQVPLHQLWALDNPGADYCGRVECTPHPDSLQSCPTECSTATFRAECRDPSEECQPDCHTLEMQTWIAKEAEFQDLLKKFGLDEFTESLSGFYRNMEEVFGQDGPNDEDLEYLGITNGHLESWNLMKSFWERANTQCPRTVAAQCPIHATETPPDQQGCDHDWTAPNGVYGRFRLTGDYKNNPLRTGDRVIIADGAKYYDGPSELRGTRGYEDGLPGTIVKEVRDVDGKNQCGVVIRFHGYDNTQDNTMYPHSTIYGKGYNCVYRSHPTIEGRRICEMTDGLRRALDDGSQLDLATRADIRENGGPIYEVGSVGLDKMKQLVRLDLQASGPKMIDEEIFIPRHEHEEHLWRI